MTWVYLDDQFDEHPKVMELSDSAFRAFVEGLCYCGRNLTDGRIPSAAVRRIANKEATVKQLLGTGLWETNGRGVVVHDYLDYQKSKQEVEAIRAKRAEAGRRGGQAKGKQK